MTGRFLTRRAGPWVWPVAIMLTAVGLRVAYVVLGGEFQPSAGLGAEMERAGAALATRGYLGNVYPGVEAPSAHVAPLYPALLAIIYLLFGVGTAAATAAQSALAIGITAVLCGLMPFAGRKLEVGELSGILAGFFLALSPLNLWVETSGAWEQPLAALALLGLLLGFATLSRDQWRPGPGLWMLGILFGLAGLLNPGLLPAGFLIILGEFLLRKERRLRIARATMILALLGLLITGPWIARNYRTFGAFIPVRGNLGLELALGNHENANGRTFAIAPEDPNDPINQIHPVNSGSERDRLQDLGEGAYMKEKLHTALGWIANHPLEFSVLTARRFVLFWFPPPDLWHESSRARTLKSVARCSVAFLLLAGLFLLWTRKHPLRVHFTAGVIGPTLIYMVTHVYPRYTYVVLWPSALVGAYVVVSMWVAFSARLDRLE